MSNFQLSCKDVGKLIGSSRDTSHCVIWLHNFIERMAYLKFLPQQIGQFVKFVNYVLYIEKANVNSSAKILV